MSPLNPAASGAVAASSAASGGIAAAVVTVIGRPLPTLSETTTAFTNVSSTNSSPEKGSLGNGIEPEAITGRRWNLLLDVDLYLAFYHAHTLFK